MDQDEPVLVIEMDKVLNCIDLPQGDRTIRLEPLPVVESVAVIAHNRRTPQSRADVAEWHRNVAWEERGRLFADLIDVSRSQEPKANIVKPKLSQGRIVGRQGRNSQLFRKRTEPSIMQQAREVPPDRIERRKRAVLIEVRERVVLGK